MKYDDLVKPLRACYGYGTGIPECTDCQEEHIPGGKCADKLFKKAFTAIEDLSQRLYEIKLLTEK